MVDPACHVTVFFKTRHRGPGQPTWFLPSPGAAECREILLDRGFDAPRWGAVAHGLRPGRGLDDAEPAETAHGWQRQLQALPRNASGAARCGQGCRQETELCCGLQAVLFLECRSPVPLPSTTRDSRRKNFGSSFCVAFGSPFL